MGYLTGGPGNAVEKLWAVSVKDRYHTREQRDQEKRKVAEEIGDEDEGLDAKLRRIPAEHDNGP